MYNILGFLNFLYSPHITQNNFLVIEKYFNIILWFFSYFLGESKFVYSNKVLSLNIKSTNPIQTYQHIIESYPFILQAFVRIFLFPVKFLIYLEYFQLKNSQNRLHGKMPYNYHHSLTKLLNDFILLHMPRPLF